MEQRIPCCNPKCRRTAPASKYPDADEIICRKCWNLTPKSYRDRYRVLERRSKKIIRVITKQTTMVWRYRLEKLADRIELQKENNWYEIRNYFRISEKPEGLENFLEEIGLGKDD